MGAALVIPAITEIVNINAKPNVSIPKHQIRDTLDFIESMMGVMMHSHVAIATTIAKIDASGGKWNDLDVSLEIVNECDNLIRQVNSLKDKWNKVTLQVNKILQDINKPSIWEDILMGVTGPAGIALIFLKNHEIDNLKGFYRKFSSQALDVQTHLFTEAKQIKDLAAEGRKVVDESVQKSWNRFMPSLRKSCTDLQASLNDMPTNLNRIKDELHTLLGGKQSVMFIASVDVWSARRTNPMVGDCAASNDLSVPMEIFPLYDPHTANMCRHHE